MDGVTWQTSLVSVWARARSVLARTTRDFFARPAPARRWQDIVWWWDSRRLIYSLFVLFIGPVASFGWLVGMALTGYADDWERSEILLLVPSIFAWSVFLMVAANAWYTGAWIVEIVVRVVLRDRWLWLGPAMLIAGVVFSVAFTAAMGHPQMALAGGQALLSVVVMLAEPVVTGAGWLWASVPPAGS